METRYTADFRTLDADCSPAHSVPFVSDDVVYLPPRQAVVGKLGRNDGANFVVLMLGGGRTGLAAQWTPDGARDIARSLMKMADLVDQQLADLAADKLDALRKSRPQ